MSTEQNTPSYVTQGIEPQMALNLAAQNNDLVALNEVLKSKININATTSDGWTALHFSAFRGYDKIVSVLLKEKIDVNIQGKIYGRTALHYAADRGHLSVVKLIIANGADITIKDSAGKTALDLSRDKGFKEITKLFDWLEFSA